MFKKLKTRKHIFFNRDIYIIAYDRISIFRMHSISQLALKTNILNNIFYSKNYEKKPLSYQIKQKLYKL